MNIRRRHLLAAAPALCLPRLAGAQDGFPSRTVTIVVPFPPGGGTDVLARVIGMQLTEAWSEQVVIDNRPGASGNIGAEIVARANPDGYTLLMINSSFAMNAGLYPKLPFDTAKDFTAVTTILWQPYWLSVHPSLPVASVKELIDMARAKPAGAIEYSSGGSGNATHIAAERFASMAGIKLTHVPYRGVGPAIVALLGGEVKLMFASSVAVQPHLKTGKIKVLAVTGKKRVAAMPDVPTVDEAGVRGFEEGNWQMVLVPSGTPAKIVSRLNAEIVRILHTPEMVRQIELTGSDVIANTPAQSNALVQADLKKYGKLIKALGIRLD